jgi:phage shock protein A
MKKVEDELAEIKARLETLEAQMQFLLRRLGVTTRDAPAAKASPAMLELLGRGDRRGAMRAFMEETGASLKDAKNFIESLERDSQGGGHDSMV